MSINLHTTTILTSNNKQKVSHIDSNLDAKQTRLSISKYVDVTHEHPSQLLCSQDSRAQEIWLHKQTSRYAMRLWKRPTLRRNKQSQWADILRRRQRAWRPVLSWNMNGEINYAAEKATGAKPKPIIETDSMPCLKWNIQKQIFADYAH